MDQTRSTLLVRIRDPADTKAWGEFVALYQPLLTAYARKRGLVEEDVRDVVQDVFARLVKINCSRILDRIRRFCAEHLEDFADGLEALPGEP